MNTSVNNIGAEVQNFYATNATHISNYASKVMEAEATAYEIFADTVTTVMSVITERGGGTGTGGSTTMSSAGIRLISEFMRETADVLTSLEKYLTAIEGEVGAIKDRVKAAEVPGGMSDAGKDPSSWRPRNTDGLESSL